MCIRDRHTGNPSGPEMPGCGETICSIPTVCCEKTIGNIRFPCWAIIWSGASVFPCIPDVYKRQAECSEPVCFSIKFVADSLLIEYGFTADLGRFLEVDYSRKVLSETLSINGSVIFSRNDGLEFESLDTIQEYQVNAFEQNAEGAIALAKCNLNDEELFLMNGFKTMFSSKPVSYTHLDVYKRQSYVPPEAIEWSRP